MRKIILSLSAALLASTPAWAINCQVQTSCTTLGYTSNTDEGGCLKCPFGNQWACVKSAGQEEPSTGECQIGAILYSDMTCSSEVISSKTPIGVVFDSDRKLAIGLETSNTMWLSGIATISKFDAPDVKNYETSSTALSDINGKKNTKNILKYSRVGGRVSPAAEYVDAYKTKGTSAGDWYLPSLGELDILYKNKAKLSTALDLFGLRVFHSSFWSSTENSSLMAWEYDFSLGYIRSSIKCESSTDSGLATVIPVLDFSGTEEILDMEVGDILFSDMTTGKDKETGKTPIGVVLNVEDRLAIALNESKLQWSTKNFDIPNISDNEYLSTQNRDGKYNTKEAIKYCQANGKSCPAFEYVNAYTTEGTSVGDWYLPASGELQDIQLKQYVLNTTLEKIGGQVFSDDSGSNGDYWSSTEGKLGLSAWMYNFYGIYNTGGYSYDHSKDKSYRVRPVLAF